MRASDFLTLHVVKTPETLGMIGKELLALAKPSLRIINVSRGGVIDEDALAEAIREGRIGGAAIDVFATEPTTSSPLFELPQVVVTPHLGASTAEAQDKAGDTIAEQVALALAGEFVPFAVNVSAAEASSTVRPFLPLAERLGQLYAGLAAGVPDAIEIGYEGQLADSDTRILTLSVLKGLFGRVSEEPVSYVNAPRLAEERGIEVRESSSSTVARLRQPGHDPRRRPRHRRHARRAAGGAAPRDGRRPLGGRPARRAHARGPQRRRARDDRRRSPASSARPASTSTTCTSAAPTRASPRSWCWPPAVPCPRTCRRSRHPRVACRGVGAAVAALLAWRLRRSPAQRLAALEAVGLGLRRRRRSSGPGWCARSSPSPAGGRSSRPASPSPGGWWGRRRRWARPRAGAAGRRLRRGSLRVGDGPCDRRCGRRRVGREARPGFGRLRGGASLGLVAARAS